jgi:hypothetical protein
VPAGKKSQALDGLERFPFDAVKGLRKEAVGTVLLYHSGPPFSQGELSGVNIFSQYRTFSSPAADQGTKK